MTSSMKAVLTIALAAACTAALAQYPDSDPRSPRYYDHQRQQREQQEQKDKEEGERIQRQSAQDAESYRQFMANQHKLQERLSGEVERDRALFLKTPPIPPQKNGLLGQWRLDRTRKKPANAFAEINAAISGPACEIVFGDGIWDFRPKALYGIDVGFGETKLTDVDYRGNEGIIGVIPKAGKLFVFKIVGADRVQELTSTRIGADPCNFVRVGASTQVGNASAAGTRAANASSSNAPPAAPGRPPALAPEQVAAVAPGPAPIPSRLSPEVCRTTLVDQIGKVGVNQVRAMSDVRFKEMPIEGKVPNTGHLRIDLRGSACDDPRIKATLYDFDANGMLQAVTYVWDRQSGPAPAPIFAERVQALSRHHNLPAAQSAGRLQADTALGRLIVQDMPERNLLLEAYSAQR